MPVRFEIDRIAFSNYLVPLGVRAKPFAIFPAEICEVRTSRSPPEILLHSGEVLFVEAQEREQLAAFAQGHSIPDVQRSDIWELINEPYLDTEFTAEQQARTLELLAAEGFCEGEVEAIRHRVGPRMLRYNAILWDWVSLSHADVLWAFGLRSRLLNVLFYSRRKAFYDWCNAIAGRGQPRL